MWNKGGELTSCIFRRKTIKTNLSRILERSFLSLWIKKAEGEFYGRICNDGGIKKKKKKNWSQINATRFSITRHLSQLFLYMYQPSGSKRDKLHIIFNSLQKLYNFPPPKRKLRESEPFLSLILISEVKKDTKRFFVVNFLNTDWFNCSIYMRTSDIRICDDHLGMQNKRNSLINAFFVT